jgi:hypothetical protein
MSDTLIDLLFGIMLVAVGAVFCFRGYLAMRVIIPMWGALAGFVLGAGLVSNLGSERFLASALSWFVGLGVALLFGLLAYLYYEVAVVLAMSAVGFAIGTSVMAILGVSWSWLVVLVGVITGAVLAIFAIVANLPMALLTVLTALAGSSTIVTGVLLAIGKLSANQLSDAATSTTVADDWWWTALYVVLAVAGMIAQLRDNDRRAESLRATWAADGGQQFRSTT